MASEGKTTTSLNLALAFAQAGSSVVLIEGDLRRPMLTPLLRMGVGLGLTDVIAGQATLPEVLQDLEAGKISFIGHGTIPPNPSEPAGFQGHVEGAGRLAGHLRRRHRRHPPLLPVVDAAVVAGAVDGTVLVARYGAVTRQQAARSVASLEAGNARLLGTVHTFVPDREPGYTYRAPVTEPEAKSPQGDPVLVQALAAGRSATGRGDWLTDEVVEPVPPLDVDPVEARLQPAAVSWMSMQSRKAYRVGVGVERRKPFGP